MRLKSEFADLDLPEFFFSNSPSVAVRRCPNRDFIHRILRQADECDLEGKGESSWNMEVHAPILDWLLRDDSDYRGCLGSEYCTNVGFLREYKPKDAPSKMIDFCLTIRPKWSKQEIIDAIRGQRPGNSINHTDWASLRKHPIAISIETKRQGEQYDAALLQIATWHSALWRSLRWGRHEDATSSLPTIEFLSGLIIQGHDWQFLPSILGEDGVSKVVRPPVQIGDTRTEPAILKLFSSLQVLKQDAEDIFWPAFKADVLGAAVGPG